MHHCAVFQLYLDLFVCQFHQEPALKMREEEKMNVFEGKTIDHIQASTEIMQHTALTSPLYRSFNNIQAIRFQILETLQR